MKLYLFIILLIFFASCTTYKLKNKYKKEYNICISLLDYYNSNLEVKDSSILQSKELSEFNDLLWIDTNKFLINNDYTLIEVSEIYINIDGSLFDKYLVFQFQVCENDKKCNVIEFRFIYMDYKYKLIILKVNPDIESKYIKPKINIYDYNSDLP